MGEFEIKSPKWTLTIFKIFLWLGILSGVIITLLIVFNVIPLELIAFVSLSIFLIILALIGIYAWHNERFFFKDKTYGYIKPFKKNQYAELKDIDHIEIRKFGQGIFITIAFVGINGKDLIKFLDDGTAFTDGLFLKSLEINQINHIYIGFDN